MVKAAKEAKVHTCWTDPDPVFEDALREIWRGVDRVEFDVLVTERGLEIREQLTLK
jgi:maltooligosyltrehalose synthase